MITKDKNKLKSGAKSKILVLGFVLIILAGLFSMGGRAEASPTNPHEPCAHPNGPGMGNVYTNLPCDEPAGVNHTTTTVEDLSKPYGQESSSTADNAFQKQIDNGCNGLWNSTFADCFLKFLYYTIFQIPSFLLWLSAQFFNAMIAIGISSEMTSSSSFIPAAWIVVRDLANIFFILILLYVAIQTILGMGHDTKKVIARVVIIALLINFSMFFTKVVIDTSNILALVFYNKLNTDQKNTDGKSRPYEKPISENEKDISGAMYRKFDATQLLSQDTITKLKNIYVIPGEIATTEKLPMGITIGFMAIAGAIMFYAAYTFFIAGISFLGRMIELWILIIFSPFAFMSWTIPDLAGVEYLGWNAWFKRLISTSFMAPIFMFFVYLIFKLLEVLPSFGSKEGAITYILHVLIPTLIILAMLKRAREFAEKGGGEFGEMAIKLGKAAVATGGALAIGGGIGLAASGLQGSLGHLGKMGFESKKLADWETSKDKSWRGSLKRFTGSKLRTIAGGDDGKGGMAGSSFDLRKGVTGAALNLVSKTTGVNLGQQSKFMLKESGGYEADLKRRDAKRKARAEGLKLKESEPEKQHLNQMKEEHQTVSLKNESAIHNKDRDIEATEAKVRYLKEVANSHTNKKQDAEGNYIDPQYVEKLKAWSEAANKVKELKGEKSAIKNGGFDETTGKYRTHNGNISKKMVETAETNLILATAAKTKAVTDGAKAIKEATDAEVKAIADATKAEADANEATRKAQIADEDLKARPTDLAFITIANNAKAAEKEAMIKKITAEKAADLAKAARTKADADGAKAIKEATDAEVKAIADATKANIAKTAAGMNEKGEVNFGNSQNQYEDDLLPKAEHHVKEINDERVRNFADIEENKFDWPWNEAARKKSAHEIRMGIKAEKGDSGGHGHGGVDVVEHALITGLVSAVSDHGHDKGSTSTPTAPSAPSSH